MKPLFTSVIETVPRRMSKLDFKKLFQQWSLLNFSQDPEYFIIQESGPHQTKQYTAGACVDGEVYGVGTARSKQAAEKLAAKAALKKLRLAF